MFCARKQSPGGIATALNLPHGAVPALTLKVNSLHIYQSVIVTVRIKKTEGTKREWTTEMSEKDLGREKKNERDIKRQKDPLYEDLYDRKGAKSFELYLGLTLMFPKE